MFNIESLNLCSTTIFPWYEHLNKGIVHIKYHKYHNSRLYTVRVIRLMGTWFNKFIF